MDAETLKALKESIAKWERNAVAETPGNFATGWRDCALCVLFIENLCRGCPVKDATGIKYCGGTPYAPAEGVRTAWFDDPALRDDAHAAAREEADFLRSLLPEGEAP